MSNLYYSYRGESAGQRPSAAPSHLSSTSNDALQLQQGVPIHSPAQPSIPFSNHQAWASDQPTTLQNHPQQSPQPSVNTSFQTTHQHPLPSLPSLPMNATRAPIASRQTQYDDNLFPIIGKPFSDNSRHQPASSPSTDQYAQLRPSQASNVFDPSEFPSLGGAAQNASSVQQTHAPPSLLSSSNAAESTGLVSVGIPVSGINPLGHYADLYSMGPYGDGRTKAVDALTGASAAAEFNMQSEDFPALGGAQGDARTTNGTAHLGSHSAAVTSVSSLGKVPPTDILYERPGPTTSASQPQGILGGRGLTQSALLMGRSAHLANGYQLGESPPTSSVLSMERGSQLASLQLTRNVDDILPSASPSRAPFPLSSQSRGKSSLGESTRGLGESDAHTRRDILRPRNTPATNASSSFPNGQGVMPRVSVANGPVSQPPVTASMLSRLGTSNEDDAKKPSGAKTSAAEKYGMKALLPIVLPLSEGNGNVENVLSVGLDLTALGLNLNSSEPLHKTFENPWDGGQAGASSTEITGSSPKGQEPEYKLPTCYYMQPPPLISSQFSKFQLETLFYIFYNMPRDVLQLLAAVELYSRKWRYHKDLKLWFTCDTEANGNYDSIGYTYFDISSWEKGQFHEANHSFIQGLMTEEELKSVKIPPL